MYVFVLPASLYLSIVPCARPYGLKLQIRPVTIARTARGRCGHDITTRHTLLAGPNGPSVHDSVAAQEPMRNRYGARPLGLLGFFTGRSIHDCDSCLRKEELKGSIVCPTCGSSIAPGASVELVPRSQAVAASPEAFRHLATTTLDRTSTVVCAACAVGRFEHHAVTLRWMKVGVMHERDVEHLSAFLAAQAAA